MNIENKIKELETAPVSSRRCAEIDGRHYQWKHDGKEYCLNWDNCPLQYHSNVLAPYCRYNEYHSLMEARRK